jgi:hypothetical protein
MTILLPSGVAIPVVKPHVSRVLIRLATTALTAVPAVPLRSKIKRLQNKKVGETLFFYFVY